jgi:hypothetical protein
MDPRSAGSRQTGPPVDFSTVSGRINSEMKTQEGTTLKGVGGVATTWLLLLFSPKR